jgi:hypothetical protein
MKLKTTLILAIFIITACQPQTAIPTRTSTPLPTKTPLPTETPSPVPAPSDIFGTIPLNSVQAFSIEPVAKAIFDQTLQDYVAAGTVQEFLVNSIAVFPSADGTLIAEITYSLRADNDPWPDDFGIPGTDGWIAGKCSRFDLVATETEHQLRNKRLCS